MAPRILVSALVGCAILTYGGCSNDGASTLDMAIDSLDVELLVDLHLSDARAELTGVPPESLRTEVLAAHGIDSAQLGALLASFAEHPEKAVALFESVTERLSSEQQGR